MQKKGNLGENDRIKVYLSFQKVMCGRIWISSTLYKHSEGPASWISWTWEEMMVLLELKRHFKKMLKSPCRSQRWAVYSLFNIKECFTGKSGNVLVQHIVFATTSLEDYFPYRVINRLLCVVWAILLDTWKYLSSLMNAFSYQRSCQQSKCK